MPRGRKKKEVPKVEAEEVETTQETVEAEETAETPTVEEVPGGKPAENDVKNEKAEQKLDPLGPGQQYFEAPDGTIVTGEATAPHLLYRPKDGGKPIWINPLRR